MTPMKKLHKSKEAEPVPETQPISQSSPTKTTPIAIPAGGNRKIDDLDQTIGQDSQPITKPPMLFAWNTPPNNEEFEVGSPHQPGNLSRRKKL